MGCGGSSVKEVSEHEVNETVEKELDPIFTTFHVGFGGASAFPFVSENENETIWVSAKSLILDEDIATNSYYEKIQSFDGDAFSTLHEALKESKFVVFWLTEGWEASWFDVPSIQELMDAGVVPVFTYWYFGDKLIEGMPSREREEEYALDNSRLARFLEQLQGKKMLIMEPEFNKQSVLQDETTQHHFAHILSQAIETVKVKNPALLVALSMMDTGSRNVNEATPSCGYEQCALGDKKAWGEPSIVFNDLLDRLDFIAFNQMIGQFSRDYANPGDWEHPNPRVYTDEELGIDYFPERMVHFSQFLHEKYHKPVFIPYMTIATATWEDANHNASIEENELDANGWLGKAEMVYRRMGEMQEELQESGLFGYAPMALFDDPLHDYGGYQYFINNEYHLGIVGSGAKDEHDKATHGDLQFKGTLLESIFLQ